MEVLTLKQAAMKAKIGVETLKRACQEGLIKATQLPNKQWRIVTVPAIMMSTTLPYQELSRRHIADIEKPFDLDDLLQTIERVLVSSAR